MTTILRHLPNQFKSVTAEELLSIARKMNSNKAAGLDGIPNRAVRLAISIDDADGLSENQYGFRKGLSAVDAIRKVVRIEGTRWKGGRKEYCLIVTLDVKYAFNSVSWNCIINSLR